MGIGNAATAMGLNCRPVVAPARLTLSHTMHIALSAEYKDGSEVFRNKISGIERTYHGMRRSRGDGNCFFRRCHCETGQRNIAPDASHAQHRCLVPILDATSRPAADR